MSYALKKKCIQQCDYDNDPMMTPLREKILMYHKIPQGFTNTTTISSTWFWGICHFCYGKCFLWLDLRTWRKLQSQTHVKTSAKFDLCLIFESEKGTGYFERLGQTAEELCGTGTSRFSNSHLDRHHHSVILFCVSGTTQRRPQTLHPLHWTTKSITLKFKVPSVIQMWLFADDSFVWIPN